VDLCLEVVFLLEKVAVERMPKKEMRRNLLAKILLRVLIVQVLMREQTVVIQMVVKDRQMAMVDQMMIEVNYMV